MNTAIIHRIWHFRLVSLGSECDAAIMRSSYSTRVLIPLPVLSNAVASLPIVAFFSRRLSKYHSRSIWRTISKVFMRWFIRICLILSKGTPSSSPSWTYSNEIRSATASNSSGYTPLRRTKELIWIATMEYGRKWITNRLLTFRSFYLINFLNRKKSKLYSLRIIKNEWEKNSPASILRSEQQLKPVDSKFLQKCSRPDRNTS